MRAFWLTVIGVVLMIPSAAAQQDNDPHMTGLPELTPEELARERRNNPPITKIKLNRIGLARVNAARAAKGLPALRAGQVEVVAIGQEIERGAPSGDAAPAAPAEAPAALPVAVDNSTLKYFPPIRSQGSLGSCGSFSGTYYTMTYMYAMAHDLDAKAGGDAYRMSPKFTYNFVNGGENVGSWYYWCFSLAMKHGCATWAQFPYDGSDYKTWCTNPAVYRSAINKRFDQYGYVYSTDTDSGMNQVKQMLSDGYILNYATYINSWQYTTIKDDPATTEDDAYVGKSICHWQNGTNGYHAMTVVGYDDSIWTDVNGNGVVDSGEKGAFRICNSWGTGWGEAGFRWVAYDALRGTSAVAGGPSAARVMLWSPNHACWTTARVNYQPKMVAEFTVNHAKRSQLRMNLGISATNTTTPASTWFPTYVLSNAGGAYAFNGGTTAMDGTFFFDFTELVPTTTTAKRWYVGAYDNASGDPATLKSFRLFEVKDTGDVLAGTAANVPQTADGGQQVYAWVDYTYNSGNMAPVAVISASPTAGSVPLTVSFDGSGSYDPDGVIASYSWNFGDGGTASGAAVSHTYTSAGTFTATLVVTDSKGVTSETNEVIVVTDPNVLDAPSGLSATVNRPTVTLNWTDNSGNETNFYVERGVKAKGKTTWSRVGTVGANVTTLSQSVADGSYQYRVQAYSSTTGRTSAYSNTVSVTVGSSKGKPPKK